jgi:triacylglycerol lipase
MFARAFSLSLLALTLVACGTETAATCDAACGPVASATDSAAPIPDASAPVPDVTTPDAFVGRSAPYPIVLLHGAAGFGTLGSGPFAIEYWRGVEKALLAAGETEVFITEATPFNTSEVRAREIRPQLEEILRKTGAAKLNLIGHSQGGLDARTLASPAGLNLGSIIASITTVSTPHRGSKIADLSLSSGLANDATNAFLQLLQRTTYDLRTDANLRAQVTERSDIASLERNRTLLDAPGVRYESYAGRSNLRTGIGVCDGAVLANEPTKIDAVSASMQASANYLEEGFALKVNDGLVTVESAKWGTFVGCIPADHGDEVGAGVGFGFDHLAFFKSVVERVRRNGF